MSVQTQHKNSKLFRLSVNFYWLHPLEIQKFLLQNLIFQVGHIKCALIADKDLWNLLTDLSAKDLLENFAKIEEIIYRSCEVKRKVVVDDELDNGVRLYLNFGHTIGHAVENTAGYGKVMHGEAVAIGICLLYTSRAHET